VVDKANVRVNVAKAEEARVSASTERHDLFCRGRICEEEFGDKEIDCRCADVRA